MKLIGVGVLLALALPLPAQDKPFDYHSSAELQQKTEQTVAKAAASPTGSAGEKIASTASMRLRSRQGPSPAAPRCTSNGPT
jgi:hypothetical protein